MLGEVENAEAKVANVDIADRERTQLAVLCKCLSMCWYSHAVSPIKSAGCSKG